MASAPSASTYKRYHNVVVLTIVALASALSYAAWHLIPPLVPTPITLSVQDQWVIFCYAFVAAWWFVYFVGVRFKVPTLRMFLRERWVGPKEGDNADYGALAEAINTKAASLIEAQGIYVAVISLLLAYVIQLRDLTPFQDFLGHIATGTALIAILLFVLSSDMIDTSSNRFGSRTIDRETWEIKRNFYTGIDPPGIRGFPYVGFACFTFFIIVTLSLVWWFLSGIGVAVFGYIGYRYWFGYKRLMHGPAGAEEFVRDEKIRWPPLVILAVFLVITFVLFLGDRSTLNS